MKSIWTGALAAAMAFSCDVHKQDSSLVTTNSKVNFLAEKTIVISLVKLTDNPHIVKFEVTDAPNAGGTVEIVLDKFMIYTPGTQSTEKATLRGLNDQGKQAAIVQITFEETQDSCGIIPLTRVVVDRDSTLQVHLVDDAHFCTPIDRTFFCMNKTEPYNGTGFSISSKLEENTSGSHASVDFVYTPPSGFVGSSKMLFAIGINVKPEYQSQYPKFVQTWLNSNDGSDAFFTEIINISYIFEYFAVSIAEVEVK